MSTFDEEMVKRVAERLFADALKSAAEEMIAKDAGPPDDMPELIKDIAHGAFERALVFERVSRAREDSGWQITGE